MQTHDPKMEEAITGASNCLQTCLQTHTHCLEEGGEHIAKEHLQLLTDCIKICETSLHFMSRNSHMHQKVCGVCADVCDACADSCEKLGGDQMEKCAAACRQCARSCREMAG